MGGDIGLTSAPGQGSTFWFTVRLQKQSAQELSVVEAQSHDHPTRPVIGVTPSMAHAGGLSPGPRLRARILLVEDNSTNQEVFLRMLELCGESADVASTGKEAIEAMERAPYDLVLMDCEMPEMDGLTASREIRRRGLTRSDGRPISIVALSGHAVSSYQAACRAAGMDGFLCKPAGLKEIRNALRQWLPTGESLAA